MERRSFIRTLLAGLALAPVAKYLIDIPKAKAPPEPRLRRYSGWQRYDGCKHLWGHEKGQEPACIKCGQPLFEPAHPDHVDVYPVVIVAKENGGTVPLGGRVHDWAPQVGTEPLTEGSYQPRTLTSRDFERSTFADWDRRVGKALLS